MAGWRNDPWWINAWRAVWFVTLTLLVVLRSSSWAVDAPVGVIFLASVGVLFWWRVREHDRAST